MQVQTTSTSQATAPDQWQTDTLDDNLIARLAPYGRTILYGDDDVLRIRGHHYRDLLLIMRGHAIVSLAASGGATQTVTVGAGQPIGEFGFLEGTPAIATVTAAGQCEALVLCGADMIRLGDTAPDLAVGLMQFLGHVAGRRGGYNETMLALPGDLSSNAEIDIRLCRDATMLEDAQRLRYDVYCRELGRDSPSADHQKQILRDDLDDYAAVFVAWMDGEAVATIRANAASEGKLGLYEGLYGMRASPLHPHATSITTKFVVKKGFRGGTLGMRMVAAIIRLAEQVGIAESYIDCVPRLLPYYQAIGFKRSAPDFLHPENGLSIPMRIDLNRYSGALGADPTRLRMLNLYLWSRYYKLANRFR
ncbi:MAG: GNAT family N-acetyltransferase [Rhizobiaceae bacterium]